MCGLGVVGFGGELLVIVSMIQMLMCGSSADEFFEDIEEFRFGDLGVSVFVDGLDELAHFLLLDLSAAAQTLEGIVDEAVDLSSLQSPVLVQVVFGEDGVDGLSELVVRWF